jgi:hypothetical protein
MASGARAEELRADALVAIAGERVAHREGVFGTGVGG